ncbi:DNA/RNA helicase [Paenibacillus sp. H1-7]|uniref:DEAD/DEAH box helicase n=1 Tax=Paenibacillus sp. H1-7 TaxID=2282849 RepID=UPI001EF99576|nr:helicase-related protein [Paenibacillus sp. H1-7]ULL19461.1 DNA/RNA helicase [Paenibacillus sp. H1-7]
MKSILYVVLDNHSMKWNLSIDIVADMDYWFGQRSESIKIRMLEPAISFGQAVVLRDKLNALDWTGKGATGPGVFLKTVREQASQLELPLPADGLQMVDCTRKQWEAYLQSHGDPMPILADELERMVHWMQGRSLLLDEVKQLMEHYGLTDALARPLAYLQTAYLYGMLQLDQGIEMIRERKFPWIHQVRSFRCRRCGSGLKHMVLTECMYCGTECPYCEECLTMGRSRYCSVSIQPAKGNLMVRPNTSAIADTGPKLEPYLSPWGLSEIQAEASGQALLFLKGNELQSGHMHPDRPAKFLIWAVTGAGKTEMIFPMIQYTVARGGRVVVATPRKDVVLELKPRLEKAFHPTPVVTLYGGSDQRWDMAPITIATTHQLLRFDQSFDLVIIDELDAFPYHNNPVLQYAAEKVCKVNGATILLSATPPRELQKAAASGRLPHVKVTARYHRHPLPVPVLVPAPPVRQQLQKMTLAPKLKQIVAHSIHRGAQLFVFVPKIHMVEPLVGLLRNTFPQVVTEGTSSKDEQRGQKVVDFRSKQTRILVTTTILERGVTIPKSDVLIVDADEPIFDSAALVQMAGRAGRSAEDPAGHVYFASKERTRAQLEAVRQIKGMNTLARKKGYLRGKGVGEA